MAFIAKTELIRNDQESTQGIRKGPRKRTTIGGQALIEGLMMVGPRRTAMAVRKADGSILVEEVASDQKIVLFEKIPFIRGGLRLFRQLITGTGALMKSAELSEPLEPAVKVEDAKTEELPEAESVGTTEASIDLKESAPGTAENLASKAREAAAPADVKKKPSRIDAFIDKHTNVFIYASGILGMVIGASLFFLLPRLIVDGISAIIPGGRTDDFGMTIVLNLTEGLVRIVLFILYLALISKMKDIARIWMYHGAEHKTIACYEAGEALTVENIRKHSRFHPRCGTAFLFVVIIVSILVFSAAGAFIGINIWWVNLLLRIILIPVVAGIAYEIIRFTGRHDDNPVCRAVAGPGMWMQRFTTREPDDSMLEVAIAAMSAVMPEKLDEDNW